MQMVYEMNFPYINHVLYLRKNFPYLDYFNRYLQAKELETQSLDLRAIFYSDTSNLAYQILSQNSRRLRDRGQGFRSLDAHTIRCKALFGMLTALNNVVSDIAKKAFAERLVCAEPKAVFDMYKVLCYYLEWLTNFPGNLFLQKEISEVAKELADKVRGTSLPEKMTAAQISLMSRLSEGSGFVAEDQLRHELISMNDYIRKNDKIVTDAIDDEMVVRDMMKYLELQMNWLEHSNKSHLTSRS